MPTRKFGVAVLETLVSQIRPVTAQVFSRNEVTSWLWLSGALLVIDMLYRIANRPDSEPFWSYSAPWRIYRHRSAILDYKFIVVQKLVIAFIVAPMLVSAVALGIWGAAQLSVWLGPGPGWEVGATVLVLFGLADLVLFDIGHYISHYLQHKVPFLWEFHKIHHAAEVLTPITSFRVHPLENIMDTVIQGPLQAIALTVFYYLYGPSQSLMTLVWISAMYPLYYLVDCLRHSHLWVSFGPRIEHILSSPAQHQIHHSSAARHRDTNFSRYFSFLDWIGGTLYVAKEGEALEFGLAEGPDPKLNTLWGLFWVPMKRAFRLVLGPFRAATRASGV